MHGMAGVVARISRTPSKRSLNSSSFRSLTWWSRLRSSSTLLTNLSSVSKTTTKIWHRSTIKTVETSKSSNSWQRRTKSLTSLRSETVTKTSSTVASSRKINWRRTLVGPATYLRSSKVKIIYSLALTWVFSNLTRKHSYCQARIQNCKRSIKTSWRTINLSLMKSMTEENNGRRRRRKLRATWTGCTLAVVNCICTKWRTSTIQRKSPSIITTSTWESSTSDRRRCKPSSRRKATHQLHHSGATQKPIMRQSCGVQRNDLNKKSLF